jgi:predicted branched-subunit amino acid permease
MSSPAATSPDAKAPADGRAAYVEGLKAASRSVFLLVLSGTYVSIGALAHGLGFSLLWVVLSTVLIWAAPAQVILVSALGAGASPLEAGLAVGLSAVRLLPMVIALLPVLK